MWGGSRNTKKLQRRTRGAAAVELAVVMPLFLLILFGIIEFGRAMTVGQMLSTAARQGARRGILKEVTNETVEELVKRYCESILAVSPDYVTVTINVEPGPESTSDPGDQLANAVRGDLCTVVVEVPFHRVSYLPAGYLARKSLTGACAMEHE